MNYEFLLFCIALGLLLAFLAAASIYTCVHSRRRHGRAHESWEVIFERFIRIDRNNVALIALDFMSEADMDENTHAVARKYFIPACEELDPSQIWPLIGGMEGLEVMRRNCAVLVDMAFYVQQWYPEALAVAEQLRLNAREIEWHVDRLKGAARTGKLNSAFPDYAQRAVTTYYLMTRRVVALFEQGDFPGLFDVQSAL